MKISVQSGVVGILTAVGLFGAGMVTGHWMTEERGGPTKARHTGFSATTKFRILRTETGDHDLDESAWFAMQLTSLTSGATLDRAVETLKLNSKWRMATGDATAQLRGMLEVNPERNRDIVTLTAWSPAKKEAMELANGVRNAYTARREELEVEWAHRLKSSVVPRIAAQVGTAEKARLELVRLAEKYQITDSPPVAGAAGGEVQSEYQRAKTNYESQLKLLNDMRERNMQLSVDDGVRKTVEVLEEARP
jgi:uncharacterized protein involved in exopolysaccharide biosynthesis